MTSLNRQNSAAMWVGLTLGVVTFLLYAPTLRHEFLAYDDQQYVTENQTVRDGITLQGLKWSFGFHAGNWHPLAWVSHMLDCQLFGLRSAGHHLTNILLHTANTVLLFTLLVLSTGARWRSGLVAAWFGWHPLHVESVAWIAERKDVLCAFFWMFCLLAYVKYTREHGNQSGKSRIWYALTVVAFAMALMSKPMAVTLPCALLVLDFWPLNRFRQAGFRHLLLEKTPLLALSAAACVLTLAAQKTALVSTAGLSITQRVLHAVVAYVHYLSATFWPHGLAVYYPYEIRLHVGRICFAAAVLMVISTAAVLARRSKPWLLSGWCWYLGTLVPVIGLVQVGDQAWADRYTYLPLIGVFVVIVWGTLDWLTNPKWAGLVAGLTCVAMLAGTSLQLRHWQNTRALFTRAERVTRDNHMAMTMLGSLLAKEGKLEEAIARYQAALRLRPGYPEAHFFLGNAYDQQGKLDAAVDEYKQALWFLPLQNATHVLLGVALGKLNRPDEAAEHYLAVIKAEPDSAVAHNNLARIRHTQGRWNEAIEHYSAALKTDPTLAQAHNNLGILLLQQGNTARGIAELRAALNLNPTNAESQFNLALALNQEQQWDEAAELFRRTVGAGFNDANAHCQFALALMHLNHTPEAMSHFATALLAKPDFPEALDGLSWILATDERAEFRNGVEAARMAQRACELTERKDPMKLRTLAAAQAEVGKFTEAAVTVQQARDLFQTAGLQGLAQECLGMLEQFKLGKPWRGNATP